MIRQMLLIALRELLLIFRSKRTLISLIIIPFLFAMVIPAIYWHQKVTHLPIAICDGDRSSYSRDLIENFAASESYGQTSFVETPEQAQKLLENGDVKVMVVIPQNFGFDLERGLQPNILTAVDGANLMYTNIGLTAATEIVRTYAAETGFKLILKKGILPDKGLNILTSLSFAEMPLNNPGYSYAFFLVYAFQIAVWHIIAAVAPGASLAREREMGTWVHFALAPVPRGVIIAGKSLAYILIGAVELLVLAWFGVMVAHVPLHGSFGLLALVMFLFILLQTAFGMFCSTMGDSPLNATRYCLASTVPAFVMTGFTWPLIAMPVLWQKLSWLFPLTWVLRVFKSIAMQGRGISAIVPEIILLSVLPLILFVLAGHSLMRFDREELPQVILFKLHRRAMRRAREVQS